MQFPYTVTIDRSLTVEVHLHEFFLGDRHRSCWTYLTHGMQHHGQREMTLSLLVDDDGDTDSLPKTPLRMFKLLFERTSGDRHVDCGDSTRLGQTGIFGFPCLYYVPAIQFDGLPDLDHYLGLVLVHQQEYDYARQYGLTRLLSRLGKFCSSFPYPTWNTQARPSLFPENMRELSMLADASHGSLDHSHVHRQDNTLQLQLHHADAGKVRQAILDLEDDQLAIMSTAFSPRCDASLYWQEGQHQPGAYAAPESENGMIGGSFVAFCHSNDSNFSIAEDGYSVNLTQAQWQLFDKAITEQRSLSLEIDGNQRFLLDYVDESARPVARHYEPVAVWQQIEEAVVNQDNSLEAKDLEAQAETGTPLNVAMGAFTNLSGENSLAERVARAELLAYFDRLHGALLKALSDETDSFSFELELTVYPHQVLARVIAGFELNPEFIEFISDLVNQIEPCDVTSQIRVRLPFTVNA